MIVFNCTKAAADYLFPKTTTQFPEQNFELSPDPDFDVNFKGTEKKPVSQWLIAHTEINAKNVLFICHIHYRYTLTLTSIKKGDVESFLNYFESRLLFILSTWMDKMPFTVSTNTETWLENYFENHEGILFCQRSDANAQSTIDRINQNLNSHVGYFKHLPDDDKDGSAFDMFENNYFTRPPQFAQNIVPTNELFFDFLINHMNVNKQDIQQYCAAAAKVFEEEFWNDITVFEKEL